MEHEKTCKVCGQLFKSTDTNRVCCSSSCGLSFGRSSQKKYYKCQHCGNLFWRPNAFRMKYCGNECKAAARRDEALERHKNVPLPSMPIIYHRKCLWCDEPFETTYTNKLYCTPECGYAGSLRLKREQWKAEYQPRTITCKKCGRTLETECGYKRSEFCSSECSDKYHDRAYKMRRNELMKVAYRTRVSFKDIYRRDLGVCQVCGLPVPYDKSPSKLWSATIDHVIPLSKGGTHEPNNCQLTHRLCNSVKLTETQDFKINWEVKNTKEHGRWAQALEDLEAILLNQNPGA